MIINISKKKALFNFIVGLLILFLIVFPKGGFRINYMPFTWGYILIALLSLILLLRKNYVIKKEHIFVLLSMIPFQLYSFIAISINGIENIGFAISFFLGFFILPFIMMFIFSNYIQNLDLNFFFKVLRKSIFFIASYGIFLFFYKIITGKLIEIPFITINYHDSGLIEAMKSINRGTFFKLISTYNNGNLYGISLLMLLPLYNYLEKNKIKKIIVKLSLVLTLSRTVWVGLLISEFLYALFIRKNKVFSIIKLIISIIFILGIIFFLLNKMNFNTEWIFDPTFGNRINPNYYNIQLLSNISFMHIEEMLYNSLLHIFGIIGLFFFIVGFFSPLFIFSIKLIKNKESTLNKTIFFGLLTYLIISISDAAILYIPILAIYWFLASFLMTPKEDIQNILEKTKPFTRFKK